jgi:hypothetical protein
LKERDISDGCIPKDTDIILSSWVTMHQEIQGIVMFDAEAYNQLPTGGFLVILDHIGFPPGSPWEAPLKAAKAEFHAKTEGPGPFVKTPVPTAEAQLDALKVAGFDDPQIIWSDLTDAVFMARKK